MITYYCKQAFTLIELLVVMVILGAILTIGIPSYSNYVLRSKVSSMYEAATAAKFVVTNDYLNQSAFTDYGGAAPTSPSFTTPQSAYISSISVVSGVITITGVAAKLNNSAINLILTPTTSQQQVTWACCVSSGSSTASSTYLDFVPLDCRTAC